MSGRPFSVILVPTLDCNVDVGDSRAFEAIRARLGERRGERMMRGAGPGAVRDTWIVAPPMALMMRAADLFFFLPKARRGAPAMALVGASVLALIVALSRLF